MTVLITGTLKDVNEGIFRVVDTQRLKDSILDYFEYVGGIPSATGVHDEYESIGGLRVPSGFVGWYDLLADQSENQVLEFSRFRAKDASWSSLAPRPIEVGAIDRGWHG